MCLGYTSLSSHTQVAEWARRYEIHIYKQAYEQHWPQENVLLIYTASNTIKGKGVPVLN